MNGQEMKKNALLKCGLEEMPDAYVLSYINSAMNILANKYNTACQKDIQFIDAKRDTWEDLDMDCLGVQRIRKKDTKYYYDDYLIENNKIKFENDGTYEIEFIRPYNPINKIEATAAINIAFHEAICYFIAYQEFNRVFAFDGGNADMLLAEFERKAEEANAKLKFVKRARKVLKTTPFV